MVFLNERQEIRQPTSTQNNALAKFQMSISAKASDHVRDQQEEDCFTIEDKPEPKPDPSARKAITT